jgi:hypothetical protein
MEPVNDQFPVLNGGRRRSMNPHTVVEVRRVLLRAFQDGTLSQAEFASTLERLESATGGLEHTLPSPSRRDSRAPPFLSGGSRLSPPRR